MKTKYNVKLLNGSKQEVTYEGIETVTLPDADSSGVKKFTAGEPIDQIDITPDFSGGDMPIESPEGYVVRSATVLKPDDAETKIAKGETLMGIEGEYVTPGTSRTVELDFSEASGEAVIFPETTFTTALDATYGYFFRTTGGTPYVVGETYSIIWDGVSYECTGQDASAAMAGAVCVGNGTAWGLSGNSEPFVTAWVNGGLTIVSLTDTAATEHTAKITQSVTPAQTVTAEGDERWNEVVIPKPENLVPENIAKGVEVAGVVGTLAGEFNCKAIDYDGTVLAGKKLNIGGVFELPDAPEHEGLVFDGWVAANYIIYSDRVTVRDNNLMVGAVYRPESGAAEIDIVLTKKTGLTFTFLSSRLTGKSSIDWGDGTVNSSLSHTYSNYGNYTIVIYDITAIADGSTSGGIVSSPNYTIVAIRVPASVTSIGSYAFYSCVNLTNIVIPASVTSIGFNAFQACYNLTGVVIPFGVTSIGSYAFYSCYNLTNIVIPASVTSIGSYAFYDCCSLTNIVIPASVTSIGFNAFQACVNLTNIVMAENVASISNYTFRYCYQLTDIVIPSGVAYIGSYAFQSCRKLTSIVIPASVTTIAAYAFQYCRSIILYDFSACTQRPAIQTDTFGAINSRCKILVPSALYDEWIAATNWSTYADYIVAA